MKKTLLLLKTGVISLSTQGTKGANSFSQKWNRLSLGFHTGFINVPRYLSSVAYGLEDTNKKISPNLKNLSLDFIEWFRGFTDAEGCFLIVKTGSGFAFRFIIKIHKDDLNTLYYIQNSLCGIGNMGAEEDLVHFKVTSLSEIKLIIEFFSNFPLNSSKRLDFLAFRRAYELYIASNQESRNEVLQEISEIKGSMNSKRTIYEEPLTQGLQDGNSHKIHITDNWLLGFIEGDGSFSIAKKDFILTFSISQKGNLPLMETIQNYLLNIPSLLKSGSCLEKLKGKTPIRNVIYLTKSKNKYASFSEATAFNYVLIIKSKDFINNILIPYLDSLTFHSKKELDYLDWKFIGQLKKLGLHYLPEGIKLINLILSQMNNGRLSNSGSSLIDRDYIDLELARLLNGPSNYELINGKIFIKSLNKFHIARIKTQVELRNQEDLVFKVFDSMNECAKFLGVSTHTVTKRMKTGVPVTLNGKEYLIVKSI